MTNSKNKTLLTIIIVVLLAAIAYSVLTMPDRRTAGDKIGDAIDALPHGVDKAARQLEDRTPGERLGDAVKDAGDDIKRSTDR